MPPGSQLLNANENLSVLLMLGLYAALLGLQVDVRVLMCGLGLLVAAIMAVLTLRQRRSAWACARVRGSTAPPPAAPQSGGE